MEDYPKNYVSVTRPLVILLGLQDEQANISLPKPLNNGTAMGTDTAPLPEYRMIALAKALSKYEASHVDNDDAGSEASNQLVSQSMVFHFKQSNRRYVFPSRKASPPPSRVSTIIGGNGTNAPSPALHSPLSPLSPGSPTFPDGVMTPLWFMKYQEALPAVFVSFFEITHDENSDTLYDNRLKIEIIAFQTRLNDLNYKGKHIVVLLGEESVEMDANIDTRLANIRKGAKLESKTTFFYLPPNVSMTDLEFFAEALAQSMRPFCTEFYKNLHKHTRRKKDRRSSSSPSTPIVENAAQHLLLSSWNARYALKMGFFSEVRFEMDAASRSYGEALDHLLSLQGTFDQISSWSPRFNDARLLADSIAIRKVRCLLADGHTAEAATFWSGYRYRTKDMVERRGKGSETYGWPCWEARWAKAMAQLVQGNTRLASDMNAKRSLEPLLSKRALAYAMADRRNRVQEQSNPWLSELHQPAYWYMLSARYQAVRGEIAHEIPHEDKVPPGRSPASSVSRVHREYESYLCPEPNIEGNEVNHAEIIVESLTQAREEFSKRGHDDCSSIVGLAIAEQLASYSPDQALTVLRTLHDDRSLRKRQWPTMLEAVSIRLYEVASLKGDRDSQVRALWVLLNKYFDIKENISYDLGDLITTGDHEARGHGTSIAVNIEAGSVMSFLNMDVCFEAGEGSAGERVRIQVSVSSAAQPKTRPVNLSSLVVQFDGLPSLVLSDDGEASPSRKSQIFETVVQEPHDHDVPFVAAASLSMFPGQTRVFAMSLPMRDTGEVRALEISLHIQKPNFSVHYTKALTNLAQAFRWHSMRPGTGLVKQRQRRDVGWVRVLPKQPKMMLHIPSLRPTYFGGERTIIDIEMFNEESEVVEVELEAWLQGGDVQSVPLSFHDETPTTKPSTRVGGVGRSMGAMAVNVKSVASLVVTLPPTADGDISLELEVRYHSQSDPQRQTTKQTSTKLNIAEPFAAELTLEPILQPDPWSSYFDPDAPGLQLRWRLKLHLKSLASEEVILNGGEMQVSNIGEGATCSLQQPVMKTVTLATSETFDLEFVMDIQKESLDDARPAIVDANMLVSWRRYDSDPDSAIRTIIPAPRLDLPTSEPRALATRQKTTDDGSIPLTITLENPSMHYLSFEISLEPTDDFILGGPTNKSLNLVPLSRTAVEFTILPMVSGTSLRPLVKVVDTYFNKLLHIHPGEGMNADDAGHLIIWMDPAR